ncbi:hypothetical protein ACLVWU_14280 [Bdellovibrio sp. HCB290]|uniref:hypothetical protein n=1 Tax=Bdellovibrio sp. HCB290 TaxID=3394356 RepID=UPI0039B41EEB
MANLRLKTVKLLCALVTIAAPASLYAQSPKVDVSQALKNWQYQESIKVVAEEKGLVKEQPVKTVTNSNSMALGGPGLDGGGGVGVITSQGQFRFLDLAVADREHLIPFSKDIYTDIMDSKGTFVSNQGTYVSNADFFACALKKFQKQNNPLLQFIKPENLRLTVVLTHMPLNNGSLRLSKVVLPSPAGTGFAWEVTQLPASNLSSSSVPSGYQRPIASYAIQPTVKGATAHQVLLVNAQMYEILPGRDKCALQIHELLRYINNVGKLRGKGISLLMKRPLTTSEIERMTNKVFLEQPIFVGEIPATNFFKYLAINGSDEFADGVFEQIASVAYSPDDDYLISAAEAQSLYDTHKDSLKVQTLYEDTMMSVGKNNFDSKSILNEQVQKLKGRTFNLRDLVF